VFLLAFGMESAYAACSTATMGSKPTGYIFHNADYDVLQVCRSDGTWQALGPFDPGGVDTTPAAFTFTDQTGVATSTLTTSDIVQISGMDDGTGVSITGTGSPEYRICADGSCSTVNHTWTTASGSIDAGEYLQLRLTSNGSNSTTNSATVMVGTVSDQWDVTTGAGGPTGCPSIGDQCSDNSYYIGDISGNKIYAASADESGTIRWDNPSCSRCGDGSVAMSTTDGEANVTNMKAFNNPGTLDGFDAARACDQKTAHGHSDWYLPAQDELNLFYNGGSPVAGIDASGTWYWSSTEYNSFYAWGQRFNGDSQNFGSKFLTRAVRCVRR
jgi:hypothetical protein